MLEALGINPGQLISQICSFLFLLVILRFVAWKPLLKALKARQARIAKTIEDAKEAEAELADAKSKADQIDKTAHQEASAILEKGRSEAEAQMRKMLEEAQDETDEIREEARREAVAIKTTAIDEAQVDIVDLAIEGAYRIMGKSLAMPANARALVDFLSVPPSVKSIGSSVTVTSAVELSPEKQDEIKTTIQTDSVEFKVDPSILGGLIFHSGTTVVDASVRGRLMKLRDAMQKAR